MYSVIFASARAVLLYYSTKLKGQAQHCGAGRWSGTGIRVESASPADALRPPGLHPEARSFLVAQTPEDGNSNSCIPHRLRGSASGTDF